MLWPIPARQTMIKHKAGQYISRQTIHFPDPRHTRQLPDTSIHTNDRSTDNPRFLPREGAECGLLGIRH